MTSIGSPPNAPSAPSAALTTPACEHDESTLTPRPRTRAARNRSSRRHRCPQGSTPSWPSLGARWGTRATNARAREAAAHLYPRWRACRSRCPRRRASPARRAPRSPQDSWLSPADWRPSRRPEAGTRKRRKVLLSRRLTNLAALSVLIVNASKRRYEMCALPEARPLLSLLAQRAAPSRPSSTWLTPASYRLAAYQPIESLHHVIDDAQRTERT